MNFTSYRRVTGRSALAASLLCFLIAAGCVTDKAVMYEDAQIKQDGLQAFVGTYDVAKWPGNQQPQSLGVTRTDQGVKFTYTVSGNQVDADFVVSKIPNSKKKLLLITVPAQSSTNQANLFFVATTDKEKTHLWAVLSSSSVAKGKLAFEQGKANADDAKKFLKQHADAFVDANDAMVSLTKRSK